MDSDDLLKMLLENPDKLNHIMNTGTYLTLAALSDELEDIARGNAEYYFIDEDVDASKYSSIASEILEKMYTISDHRDMYQYTGDRDKQRKINRSEFESDLLNQNVTDKYLNMSREELEKRFGNEFLKIVDFGNQNNNHHQYELFEHILRTVDNISTDELSQNDVLKVKIAAFFHDIGKPDVAQINEKTGQTQYIGHAKQSVEKADEILVNLGYSEQEIEEINFLIQSHDDFMPIAKIEDVTETKISKVLSNITKKAGNYTPTISDFKKLITLCKADAMAQKEVIEKDGQIVDTQSDRIARLEAVEEILPRAIILQQENEIQKLEKQKNDLINGPEPIEKKGKIVNQKQIDLWNAKSEEQKKNEMDSIDEKISVLRAQEDKLLEKDERQENFEVQEKEEPIEQIISEEVNTNVKEDLTITKMDDSHALVNESKFAQIYGKAKGRIQEVFSKIKSFIKGKSQEKENNDQDISNR